MASEVLVLDSFAQRSDILYTLWRVTVTDTEKYELYFKYYDGVCSRLSTSREISEIFIETHEDLFHIMDVLWEFENISTLTRPSLRKALQQPAQPSPDQSTNFYPRINSPDHLPRRVNDSKEYSSTQQRTTRRSDEKMDNTINLALRLWLTMDIRGRQFGGVGDIQWNDDSSLGDFIEKRFPTTELTGEVAQSRDVLLDEEFTAPNLFRRRGIKTKFTDKLSNHLIYDAKAETLMVYPLKQFLTLHKTCGAGILPDKLIDETIKSLGILFPQDSRTETFMEQFDFKGRLGHDYPFPLPASTRLLEFDYLQDRLAAMYFKLKGPPTTWRQKYHEDLAEWFSFWGAAVAITIMTFVFGSISVGLAVWSAIMAQQSLEIAREGLELARDAAALAAKSALTCTQAICNFPTSTAIVKLAKRF